MKNVGAIALLLGAIAGSVACGSKNEVDAAQAESAELAGRARLLASRVAAAASDSTNAPLAKWWLPVELREVSGLALTADGRLLAHNDEQGKVYVMDPRRGVLLKQFAIGERGMRGDFEGITVSGNTIYMLTSNGNVYQFQEGADGARVPVTLHDTRLGRECEFEGVAYAPDSAWLVLPCKNIGKKNLRDQLLIYRWHIGPGSSPRLSMLSVPLIQLIRATAWKNLNPTDITIEPKTGNYVLIAAQQNALIEITPAGDLVRAVRLPGDLRQAEGVAITRDGILIVSDEGLKTPASINLFRWPLAAPAAAGASQ